MENNQLDGELDISRFLEKFNQNTLTSENTTTASASATTEKHATKTERSTACSFEKLEEKIQELEEKISISAAQNQAVLQELAFTRKAVESQKTRDAYMTSLAASIASLRESVDALSRARSTYPTHNSAATTTRGFDVPSSYYPSNSFDQQAKLRVAYEEKAAAIAAAQAARLETEKLQTSLETERISHEQLVKQLRDEKTLAQAGWEAALAEKEKLSSSWDQERAAKMIELDVARTENTEKIRLLESLQQKASQLKAVNVALDREIKRVQQERTEALRKSAEQAKEILSLRDALNAAEERLKTFNFDGRIISIKREYDQKVSHLESQLEEVTATCMKQVEEIEALKAENIRLHKLAEEREQLSALYDEKTQQLSDLQQTLRTFEENKNAQENHLLEDYKQQIEQIKTEQASLSEQLTQTQSALQQMTEEKQSLQVNFKALQAQIEENDAIISGLRDQISVLTQENEELKNRPSSSFEIPAEETPREPVIARRLTPKHPAVNRAQAKAAVVTMPPLPPQSAPIELQNTLRAAIQTDDDLPEIRVADPIPQEDLYNGEDFLERTDSFIGRMKWSIFREDK